MEPNACMRGVLMVVCSCRAVSDRDVRVAILAGATSPEQLADICGAGGKCGGCWPTLSRLIDDLNPAVAEQQLLQAS